MTTTTTFLSREAFLEAFQRRWHISPEIWALLGLDVQPCDCGGLPRCEGWQVVALTRQELAPGVEPETGRLQGACSTS